MGKSEEKTEYQTITSTSRCTALYNVRPGDEVVVLGGPFDAAQVDRTSPNSERVILDTKLINCQARLSSGATQLPSHDSEDKITEGVDEHKPEARIEEAREGAKCDKCDKVLQSLYCLMLHIRR